MELKRAAYFIPFFGCERRCAYCDQRCITGQHDLPSPDDIARDMESRTEPVELCFFGGSFGRLDDESLAAYLSCLESAPDGSVVTFSTYPGDIDGERGSRLLDSLARVRVGTIEFGVPSLDPAVLSACGRDDDPSLILRAIARARDAGHHIGIQIMTGLPRQTKESNLRDLRRIAPLMPSGAAWHLRIYPCLVLEGTELAEMYRRREYSPQGVDDAALDAGEIMLEARGLGYVPIRVGLQESRSLARSVIAGPHHPAFGELAASEMTALELVRSAPRGPWAIPRDRLSLMTGHGRRGYRRLAQLAGITPKEAESLVSYTLPK